MKQISKITDWYIASARLDFLYSKLPIKEWRGLPYYGKATVRIEIPAGLTNEEVKGILDKAYTAYVTAQ